MKVLVVDAGMGNLRSVRRALERAGGEVELSGDPERVRRADRVVVPGQGAFGRFAEKLAGGLGEALREHLAADRPYLGICLGMQALFATSAEDPEARGLAVLPGRVRRFSDAMRDETGRTLKVPHMGWNEVRGAHPLLSEAGWFYFVHAFVCEPEDDALVVGRASYGDDFCAALARGALFACQFHPEKSQRTGHRVLERFLGARWS